MFVRVIPNNKGNDDSCYCSLCESYREDGKVKHRVLINFGRIPAESVPYIKAAFAKKKPKLVYDDE